MQYVKLIKQCNSEILYFQTNVAIDFNKQQVLIWNGVYWEETPFKDYKIITTYDENKE